MEIAPNFSSEQWFLLQLKNNVEDDWQRAIDVLKDRLYSRYIEPIEVLLKSEEDLQPKDRKFGFTILAIDLLLMETLQAFKDGIPDTKGKSRSVFKRFLEKSPHFSPYFPNDDSRQKFWESFRCGILHQAEVQSSALVWSIGDLHEKVDDIEIINRNAVHQSLKQDLDDYLLVLREPQNVAQRQKFRDKMDAIANRGSVT